MIQKFLARYKLSRWELLLLSVLFVFLSIYLTIRANTVFYVHDEIVTKWAYMISWNPLPYHGFVDANNHFFNSLLGGFFIRLFKSDAMWIVRLPNLLAFPIYFWSVFGLYNLFEKKVNFYWLLITLTCSAFFLEFFSLARGYGISMALLVLSIQQTITYLKKGKIINLIITLFSWVFAVYANLSLLPIALAGMIYLSVFLWKERRYKWIMAIVFALLPLVYAAKYSFYLKQLGRLYCGQQDGIIHTTVHSFTTLFWNSEGSIIDIILVIITIFILFTLIWSIIKSKSVFNPQMVFSLFFVVSIINIIAQNKILNVVFPLNRAAIYLAIFFFGGFCFTADYWKNGWLGYIFILITFVFFSYHFNFSKVTLYDTDHFDKELLTKIPDQIRGIPPSTGGRYWDIDNELMRTEKLPLRVFQEIEIPYDTLEDYIISKEEIHPELIHWYHPIYTDKISGITLFERNNFLPRKKMEEDLFYINGTEKYFDFYRKAMEKPLFFRCSGNLEDMDIFKQAVLVVSAEDSIHNENIYYRGISLTQSSPIDENGKIYFDFTFAINYILEANLIKVYLWNDEMKPQKGEIKLEIYEIN